MTCDSRKGKATRTFSGRYSLPPQMAGFIANNSEPGKTSLQLGIHRNTLSYRLQQIKKHIQLDPMMFTDLVQLSVSVHCYRRQNPRQSEWIDTLS